MLSICIPVYNVDVTKLVHALIMQSNEHQLEVEILVFDDDSNAHYKAINSPISQLNNVTYKELDKNIGRAAIRNLMAKSSVYPNLLFIDSDSEINKYYLLNYKNILGKYNIVCGGRVHPSKLPVPSVSLRWSFGRAREDFDADTRTKNSNTGFISNNFLVKKSLFHQIQFNEQITQYGHEDTMLGIEMEKLGITITHIDNPVTHIGLEENKVFVEKTKVSITTLLFLLKNYPNEALLFKHIKLLKYFNFIKSFRLLTVLNYIYHTFETRMVKNFYSEHPNLRLFDLYKLCYLSVIYLKYPK
ncbi:glycosyltransferase [Carboxylicivirga sp. A043]|uniref:glycosyltransferase family 2 protein n=1 Tax=Carboxylicivirga litoralis TaxID=2816963 RepID=UPI0021CB840B|nr:glycosyltransferase [Carboxylicivirga sp. A043]MCU4157682.1 glycosyltransferase [Carboxylicivirga sp. A043]